MKTELYKLMKALEADHKYNKLAHIYPETGPYAREKYFRQMEFFEAGAKYKQRLFSAANRSGKTYTCLTELAYHLTGLYPKWWNGYKFDGPNPWLVVGQTSLTTTAILQRGLLGDNGEFGSGIIPKHLLDFESLPSATKMGVSVNGFRVKHVSGGYSTVNFRSQEMGILSMVGVVANIYCDEPLKLDLYTELITRTATINGMFMMSATPILGFDAFLREFCNGTWQTGEIDKFKWVGSQTWDETPHLSQETIEMLINSYPVYQRDCRSKGIPMLGAGAVYPVAESDIVCDPFEIPGHWKKCAGLDVGTKTAAVWLAINPDDGMIYVTSEYFQSSLVPSQHASNLLIRGDWIPFAIDSAAHGRSQIDGENIYQLFQDNGLDLTNADKAVEAGLFECYELLATGRLKIFHTCKLLLKDILSMARDTTGRIIDKSSYHMGDSFRYAVKTRDIAKTQPRNRQTHNWTPGYKSW